MGNKTAGRQIAQLSIDNYINAMGGKVDNYINTGVSFTSTEVYKYYKLLKEYAVNRVRWTSSMIPQSELKLIEYNLFEYGKCAMVRPIIYKNNHKIRINTPKIFKYTASELNTRNGRPLKISIFDNSRSHVITETNHTEDNFVIFTDEFLFPEQSVPFSHIAFEYANKLHELDLAFNANSHRLRMPFVFNNASVETDGKNSFNIYANKGQSIAEIMRSAFGRNEQFVEIPQTLVGSNFMHEPQYVNNEMINHLEAQKKLYQAYFELLGLYTNRDKGGVYTVKRLQENGDETGDYITETLQSTRQLCAYEAVAKFGIDLKIEVI